MAKFKPLNENQLVMLPSSLQDQLVPDTLEPTISEVVEKHLDLSVFDARYKSDETGAAALHPKIRLNVIWLAYARGLIRSRPIERAGQENMICIALAYGDAPDPSPLASLVASRPSEIQTRFSKSRLVGEGLGRLDGTQFSLAGVKRSAHVSQEWSGTLEDLKPKRDNLQEKLQRVIAEHAQADPPPEGVVARQKKRERRFPRPVARLNECLKVRAPKRGSDGKESQSHAVDNESVKRPSAHGVVQGYTAPALVDANPQIIRAAEAFASPDPETLQPRLAGAKKNLQSIGKDKSYFEEKQLTADSNSHSLNRLTVGQDEKIEAYLPDSPFRKRDPRFADPERFKDGVHGRQRPDPKPSPVPVADFSVEATRQVYLCPPGQELTCPARNQVNRHRPEAVYPARGEDCAACPWKARCLSQADASRRYLSIQVQGQPRNLFDELKAKLDSEEGQRIYARRLAIVEPVLANLCVQKPRHRFTLRAKRKGAVQWRLFALVHNIGKIHTSGTLN